MIRHLQKVSGVLRLVQHNVSPYSPREREPSPSQERVGHLDELDKNHRQNDDPFDSSGDGRMYENTENPASCPVKAFEQYLSKLNPSLDSLTPQRPKAFDNFNESVFGTVMPL